MSLADPTGKLLTDIRDDATVAALVSGRVRAGEAAPGDALGAGHWQAFVVLARLGHSRSPHAPTQAVRYVARCYAATHQGATALAAAVSDAIHAKGRRISGGGVSIFGSFDDGGGGSDKDPDTDQPVEYLFIDVGALTSLIP